MLTKEDIVQICRDSLKVENLTNSGTDRDTYSFKLYFETVADKISSRLEELVKQGDSQPMQTTESLEQKIKEFADIYGLECPSSSNCCNGGTLSEHGCNGTEEDCENTCPVPVQCEFCYTEPRSKFNLINDLKEMIGGLRA
jgi:hypothetical protein